jgi:hypothetical protein
MAFSAPAFEPDPWLDRLQEPVLGLNVAMEWPLPAAFRPAYERLRARLLALDDAVYVYPFDETHVTIATLVSFKRHPADETSRRRLLDRVPSVARALDAMTDLHAFTIDVGAPVLVETAAFLPIANATGEVAEVRRRLKTGGEWPKMQVPRAIHSTLLRFHRPPRDPRLFQERFDEIAADTGFGRSTVSRLLVTLETRPYMTEGETLHSTRLQGVS